MVQALQIRSEIPVVLNLVGNAMTLFFPMYYAYGFTARFSIHRFVEKRYGGSQGDTL